MKHRSQIRKARPEDWKSLQDCMQSAYAGYQKRMGKERLPPMEADYLSEIENYPTWLVEERGITLGALIMVFEADTATIANVAVNPKFQGQGVGGALMRFAESKARERGYAKLQLATHVLLHENLSLYGHLGWRETGRVGNKILMAKEI